MCRPAAWEGKPIREWRPWIIEVGAADIFPSVIGEPVIYSVQFSTCDIIDNSISPRDDL
jgi:hypothetical protein